MYIYICVHTYISVHIYVDVYSYIYMYTLDWCVQSRQQAQHLVLERWFCRYKLIITKGRKI